MKLNWKKTLATVAPTIATALGGPLAGVAVSTAAKALGIEADENALSAAVASGNPDILLKLKEAEQNFELELERLGVEREKIHADDRNSAREMAGKTTLKPQIILACMFITAYSLVLFALFTGRVEMSRELEPLGNILLGTLSAGVMQILNFFYGSSSGSKEKTMIMGGK